MDDKNREQNALPGTVDDSPPGEGAPSRMPNCRPEVERAHRASLKQYGELYRKLAEIKRLSALKMSRAFK